MGTPLPLCGTENLPAFDLMQRKRVPFAIWVTLWAIIVIAALALIITVVAWFAIPWAQPTGLSRGLFPELRGFVAYVGNQTQPDKYRLRAEIQRKLEKMQSNTNEGSKIGRL
jgi:hypothetical protein